MASIRPPSLPTVPAAACSTFSVGSTSRFFGTLPDGADPPLAGFWIVSTTVAVATLGFVYAVKPILQLRAPYRVASNRRVAERMWEVAVEPERGPAIDFAAGQFVWLNLGHSPFSVTEHPFSTSSAPQERPRIAFTIKQSGDFTNHIGEIFEGTRAYLDGPHGNFTMAGREPVPLVFIAGGVGFASIMGILRELAAHQYLFPVHLIYGNRAISQIRYRDEVGGLRQKLDLKLDLVLSEPPEGWHGRRGELKAEVVRSCLSSPDPDSLYFVCGPLPMMNSVEATLAEMGVPPSRIISERFRYN